ncbi:histidinol-phosphate transaminase [Solimonas sp. C16B3]|uniref:Histidinol-phosphate aminotransferase n=1 Tax=Solimonas marina TaxID=2714601 RepID=A0A969WA76_9GAMM|nr:histidinol-phosphate transaminase [Solimonas marina]
MPDVYFNPHVASLPKYNAGLGPEAAQAASGLKTIARLASNENPYGCSPSVSKALEAVEPWRYSDPGCHRLRLALSEHLSVSPDKLVIGNGSEEMIAASARAFLRPDATALTVSPCFGLHEIEPLAVGAKVEKVPMTPSFEFDIIGLERALARSPHLLFLPSPWNPVGAALNHKELRRLVSATPDSTMFVLDEAYYEFTSEVIPDGLSLLRESGRPYIVLRTFSKAFGLAGLRVGYAVCSSAPIARMLAAAKTPFNVNASAQAAALAALADPGWMQGSVRQIVAERERVANRLRQSGLRVAPSEGNFLFVETGRSSECVARDLLKAGVIVKPWMETPYDSFIRVSVGTPEENDQFLGALLRHPGASEPAVSAKASSARYDLGLAPHA